MHHSTHVVFGSIPKATKKAFRHSQIDRENKKRIGRPITFTCGARIHAESLIIISCAGYLYSDEQQLPGCGEMTCKNVFLSHTALLLTTYSFALLIHYFFRTILARAENSRREALTRSRRPIRTLDGYQYSVHPAQYTQRGLPCVSQAQRVLQHTQHYAHTCGARASITS